MNKRFFTLLAALLLLAVSAFAQNASDLRRRMEQRLPALDELKAKGVVGENNRGFAEIRDAGTAAAEKIVAEENSDREQVYALIAKETDTHPDTVARARARQIAASSRSGVWVQDSSGRWHRK